MSCAAACTGLYASFAVVAAAAAAAEADRGCCCVPVVCAHVNYIDIGSAFVNFIDIGSAFVNYIDIGSAFAPVEWIRRISLLTFLLNFCCVVVEEKPQEQEGSGSGKGGSFRV
eukprot:185468-Chlamydomonas_euryale.AAC.2